MVDVKHCFVIMPFSDTGPKHTAEYWTKFYSDFIKRVIEKHGYACERSSAEPRNIMKAIVKKLVTSDVVLAVLTDFNANVMYELGARHSLKRGTIMILENGQNIPFDIQAYGVILYDDQLSYLPRFEEDLLRFIEKIENSQDPDNPVKDFLNHSETSSTGQQVAENRRLIYDGLSKNIFSRLVKIQPESLYDYPINLLKLYYDLSDIKDYPDYDEAKLHWEQDLKNIGVDPEQMESQVNGLDTDIDEFFPYKIRELVIAAIATDGKFTAFESITAPPLNNISIPNVIADLAHHWIDDTGSYKNYDSKTRRYALGKRIIATIEPQDEIRLDRIIDNLKSNTLISNAIQSFQERRTTILEDLKTLNKEINKRIINPIDRKLYKTTCSKCDDNALGAQ